MTFIEIGAYTLADWIIWLHTYIGEQGSGWKWNDDSCGHYFICFNKPEDAAAFKLKFEHTIRI